ncbi:MAG: NAD(P)-binding protein [Verrucomicrobia bacterium]|nr:NAD(P)-binding protein [Verrucomicrobiota bacterium]
MKEGKILVAGAGPVGLSTAICLHDQGLKVEVIDRDDRTGTHSYALALHPHTVRLLKKWGKDKGLREKGHPVRYVDFYDHERRHKRLGLEDIPGFEGELLVLGQDHLEEALNDLLEERQVPVHWNHRLTDLKPHANGVELRVETLVEAMSGYAMARMEVQVEREYEDHADYLVGTDGHFSLTRRKLGLGFPKVGPTQSFAVFEFKTDADLGEAVHVVFHENTTSVLWPLPGGYCRWGFEVDEAAAAQFTRDKDRLMMQVGAHGYSLLDEEVLHDMLKERASWFSGSIGEFRWRMIVRFEKRLAEGFGSARVWLAGDAAHLAPPVGMQSMNIGIREGGNLADAIAGVRKGGKGEKILEAYNMDRQREWRSLLGMDVAFVEREHTIPLIRNNLDQLLGCLPASLDNLQGFAEALDLDLDRG